VCRINKWHNANIHEFAGTNVGKQTCWQPANHRGSLHDMREPLHLDKMQVGPKML